MKKRFPMRLIPIVILAGILGGGALWQLWGAANDNMLYAAPGYIVPNLPLSYAPATPTSTDTSTDTSADTTSVKTHKNGYLHVYVTGISSEAAENSPTVLLLGDWRDPAPTLNYTPIIKAIKDDSRVVVIERPGHGWSGTKFSKRTVDNMVSDDLFALEGVAEDGPFVVVADGTAALEAIHMAAKYPELVAGLVFVNAPPPAVYVYNPALILDILQAHTYFVPRVTGIFRTVNVFAPALFEPRDGVDSDWFKALYFRNVMSSGMRAEIRELISNAHATLADATNLREIPGAAFVYSAQHDENAEITRVWDDFNAAFDTTYSDEGADLRQAESRSIAQAILDLVNRN
ncbi:hypothetical protein FACS1894217_02580 [Clostridia bacterium]|nr:hypothetical protein FACS1894217_02580 [Clostridia bacterium]